MVSKNNSKTINLCKNTVWVFYYKLLLCTVVSHYNILKISHFSCVARKCYLFHCDLFVLITIVTCSHFQSDSWLRRKYKLSHYKFFPRNSSEIYYERLSEAISKVDTAYNLQLTTYIFGRNWAWPCEFCAPPWPRWRCPRSCVVGEPRGTCWVAQSPSSLVTGH